MSMLILRVGLLRESYAYDWRARKNPKHIGRRGKNMSFDSYTYDCHGRMMHTCMNLIRMTVIRI